MHHSSHVFEDHALMRQLGLAEAHEECFHAASP